MNTFNISIKKNAKPENTQCTAYKAGATNKNVNSNGSVIPVKNDVNAAVANNEPTTCFLFGLAALYIANAAPGRPNIMNGNLPAINLVVPLITSLIVEACTNCTSIFN